MRDSMHLPKQLANAVTLKRFRKDLVRLTVLGLLGVAQAAVAGDKAVGDATEQLRGWSELVEQRLFQVGGRVHTAVGYTLSANSMIVGEDGLIIVDPGHAPALSAKVRAEFERIADKPVAAIIFTHGHGDHFGGAAAFLDEGRDIPVWARANFGAEIRANPEAGLKSWRRPAETQGGDLPPDQQIRFNGPIQAMTPQQRAAMMAQGGRRMVRPTHRFAEEQIELTIAGVPLKLVAAPGETSDQLYVWLPEDRVLFAGDNLFHTWPNVYPLRGADRSIRDWADSLDKMIREEPRFVVAGHGNPLLENPVEQLINRRDAMRWMYDRTIEGMQRMMTPDDLVEYAQLPERFASLDYLQPYYGSWEGTIRQIYAQLVGWFDGNPLNLHRETSLQQAQRMARLLGGEEALAAKAREAAQAGDPLGAAQLAQHLLRLQPNRTEAKRLLADALEALAQDTLNMPMRNYSLSYALQLRAQIAQQE